MIPFEKEIALEEVKQVPVIPIASRLVAKSSAIPFRQLMSDSEAIVKGQIDVQGAEKYPKGQRSSWHIV